MIRTLRAPLPLALAALPLALMGMGCRSDDRGVEGAPARERLGQTTRNAEDSERVSITSAEQLPSRRARAEDGDRDSATLPMERPTGSFEVVARFLGPIPTGVAVSRGGRIFVNFPRWGDPVESSVVELRNETQVPFPDAEMNRWPPRALDVLTQPGDPGAASRAFVSVQSVVVDPIDRLWIVDTGAPEMKDAIDGGPKLVAIELATNRIVETIPIPSNVALRTSYLNDVRFDLRRGTAGFAFVTDSSSKGPNGIIVVDLATKKAVRRLHDHPSTKPVKGFVPFVEGKHVRQWEPDKAPQPLAIGSDGIAIAADGSRLFYCPLSSRHLYSVSVDALVNVGMADSAVAATVQDHGEKGASDGLESDAQGRIYLTDYEHNAIRRTRGDGVFETLVADPRVLWPDTMALAHDGHLYFIANQLHRQPRFHSGTDERARPFLLLRTKVDGTPVALRR